MDILKEQQGGESLAVTPEELALINLMSRRELGGQEVYTFSVRLCDNEVDRDFERFTPQTLEELSRLFVGKSGIFDHQWSARGQAARIYKSEVVHQPQQQTRAGDGYCWLKGYAYMVRTDSTHDLIAEIEAGIKKEVSVGCAVERSLCSICKGDTKQGGCAHQKGQEYEGQLCFYSLEGATDAYEFSFVAVPAQPLAGVVKGGAGGWENLKAMARKHPACAKELEQLEQQAQLGRSYLEQLRQETVRLGRLTQPSMGKELLQAVAQKLSQQELVALKSAWEQEAARHYPLTTQLGYGEGAPRKSQVADGAFLI